MASEETVELEFSHEGVAILIDSLMNTIDKFETEYAEQAEEVNKLQDIITHDNTVITEQASIIRGLRAENIRLAKGIDMAKVVLESA